MKILKKYSIEFENNASIRFNLEYYDNCFYTELFTGNIDTSGMYSNPSTTIFETKKFKNDSEANILKEISSYVCKNCNGSFKIVEINE